MTAVARNGSSPILDAVMNAVPSWTSSAVTVPNLKLITVMVIQFSGSSTPGTPVVSTPAMGTLTHIAGADSVFGVSNPNDCKLTLHVGVGTGATEAFTVASMTNTASLPYVCAIAWDNAATGSGGTAGIRLPVVGDGISATITATLAALRDTESMAVGFAVDGYGSSAPTTSGATTDVNRTDADLNLGIQHKSNVTALTWSTGGSDDQYGFSAFEIVSAAGGGGGGGGPTTIFGGAGNFANPPNGQAVIYAPGDTALVYTAALDGAGAIQAQTSLDHFQSVSVTHQVDTGMNAIPLDEPMVMDTSCPQSLSGRRLHLIYGSGVNVGGSAASIFHRFSDDDGSTWSARHTIDDGSSWSSANGQQPRLGITARGGVVNVVYIYQDHVTFFGQTGGAFTRRSTDGGQTFAAKTQQWTGAVRTTGAGAQRPVLKDDGTYLHLAWMDAGNGSGGFANQGGDVYYSRSANNGANWSSQKAADHTAFTGTTWGMGRPHVHSCGNGKVVIVGMADFANGVASDLWTIRSTDWGVTWGAPVKIVTHSGSNGLSHPAIEGKGDLIWCVYCEVNNTPGPNMLREIHSTDGGATWSSPRTIYTYTTTGAVGADAPWVAASSKMMIAGFNDISAGSVEGAVRNPAFMSIPDITAILDDASSNADPATGWAVSNGNVISATTVSGDGLKVASLKLQKRGTTSFREGSWRSTPPAGANYEVGIEIAAVPVSAGDGFSLYGRWINPHSANASGWKLDFFQGEPLHFYRSTNGANDVASPGYALDRAPSSWTIGDKLYLQFVDNSIRVWFCLHGTTEWELLGNRENSLYGAAGNWGLDFTGTTSPVRVDRFYGKLVTDPSISGGITPVIGTTGPSISGITSVGQTLTAAPGSWTPTPSGYTWRWQRADNTTGLNLTDIPGATGQTYQQTSADLAKFIRVGVIGLP